MKLNLEMRLQPARAAGLPAAAPARLRQGYGGQPSQGDGAKVGGQPGAARPARASERGGGPASIKKCLQVRHKKFALVIAALLLAAGCRQDMHNQPKYRPLRASGFFQNGSSARPLVEGTVARGMLNEDTAFFTGKVGKELVKELPFPVTQEVVDRGEDRYNIFCAPCHDRTGSGNGMVVQRGYRQPPSMHIDRLRQVEPGHFFDVMTNGFGAMPDYRAQITPRDRWNIVAYIRALQLAEHAQRTDIPGGDPTKVQPPSTGSAGPQKH